MSLRERRLIRGLELERGERANEGQRVFGSGMELVLT